MFCSSISSLSEHAINHLFKECAKFHIWSLLETRLDLPTSIQKHKGKFNSRARASHATPAIPAIAGGLAHGGKMIAYL